MGLSRRVRESLEGVAFRLATRRARVECGRQFDVLVPQMHDAARRFPIATLGRPG